MIQASDPRDTLDCKSSGTGASPVLAFAFGTTKEPPGYMPLVPEPGMPKIRGLITARSPSL